MSTPGSNEDPTWQISRPSMKVFMGKLSSGKRLHSEPENQHLEK